MQELGMMERFADPALFVGLTTGEKAAAALVTTLMGMGTTFIILTLLWGIIALTSRIIKGADAKAAAAALAKTAEPRVESKSEPLPVAEPVQAVVSQDASQELIAVIMAAIAATEGPDLVNKLRISKIQRISGPRPAWNQAGSADCVESRKI